MGRVFVILKDGILSSCVCICGLCPSIPLFSFFSTLVILVACIVSVFSQSSLFFFFFSLIYSKTILLTSGSSFLREVHIRKTFRMLYFPSTFSAGWMFYLFIFLFIIFVCVFFLIIKYFFFFFFFFFSPLFFFFFFSSFPFLFRINSGNKKKSIFGF